MTRWICNVGAIASICFSSLTFVNAADAQSSPTIDPKALELFVEGAALMEQGQYAAACPKFERSLGIQYGIGALFNLADCQSKIGRTASAWRGFRAVTSATKGSGQAERAEAARARADALEPKLSRLRVDVAGARTIGAEIKIQVDGAVLAREKWGLATPVDPGNYKVTASASGKVLWSGDVDVREPGQVVVVVTIPSLDMASVSPSGGPNKVILIAGLAGAAAALGSGVGFSVASQMAADQSADFQAIDREQFDAAQGARVTYANAAFWSFLSAGVIGASTATYYLLPLGSSKKSAAERSIRVGVTGGGLAVAGRW